MFYSDTIFTQYNKSNSFAYKRKAGVQSVFDKFDLVGNRYKNDYYPVAKNISGKKKVKFVLSILGI
jgi:hypothetical protein